MSKYTVVDTGKTLYASSRNWHIAIPISRYSTPAFSITGVAAETAEIQENVGGTDIIGFPIEELDALVDALTVLRDRRNAAAKENHHGQ